MKTLGALEARFADDHVPLALVLGALGALSAVRRLLPEKATGGAPRSTMVALEHGERNASLPEPFVTLLLGVIATHERLLAMLSAVPARDGDQVRTVSDGGDMPRLEGLLR